MQTQPTNNPISNAKDCSFLGIFLIPEGELITTTRFSTLHEVLNQLLEQEPDKELLLHISTLEEDAEGHPIEGITYFRVSQYFNSNGNKNIIIC